jgi:RNA polymerase sigma factor (sigma-70 family)
VSDGPSVEEAYRKWADDLVRYATALVGSADASDLVAESFAGVLRAGEERWRLVRDPRAYLFRVVCNNGRMSGRGRRRRERRELVWLPVADWSDQPADAPVLHVLSGLSMQQRAVTFLTYWEDMSIAEVAAVLGISQGSVKKQLARARAALRKELS